MKKLLLFTDGSVNTKSKVGFGAYLIVNDIKTPLEKLKEDIKTNRFENTSSTKLELETLLNALNKINDTGNKIFVYTDSQNILSLFARRRRFELNDYMSNNGKLLSNHKLYKEFYKITDRINCEFIKVEGHKPSKQKSEIENIFTLVDRASRNALRDSS